jgi:hypothetical protein
VAALAAAVLAVRLALGFGAGPLDGWPTIGPFTG